MERSSSALSARWRLAVFVLALLACLSGPNVTNYDSYLAVPVAWSVLRHGDLDLDEYEVPALEAHHGYVRVDGQAYDFYPWPVALLAVPTLAVTAAGAAAGWWPGVDDLIRDNTMDLIQLVTASFITAAATVVMAMVAFERFEGGLRARGAAVVGLLFLLATTMWSTASRALWQHGPAALFVALTLLEGQRLLQRLGDGRPPRNATWTRLGLWAALATVMRPTAAIAVAAIAVAVLWEVMRRRSGRRGPLLATAGGALVMVPFLVLNVTVFGSALPTSYSANRLALHDHYLEALGANLISPARGVLISVPLVAVAVVAALIAALRVSPASGRRDAANPMRVACLIAVAVHWLVISAGSFGWWAGHSYGARFFTEVTPLMAYLGLDLVDRVRRRGACRRVVVTLAVVGMAVQVPGVYLRSTQCWNGDPTDIDADPGRIWTWRAPPFLHPVSEARNGVPLRQLVLGPCPPPAPT